MITLLITGSGTAVGKTRAVAALARATSKHGHGVQIVKPVQTGAAPGEPADADIAAELSGAGAVSVHTLRRYAPALAPLAAAARARARLSAADLVMETLGLPAAGVRLVEGAGGIAVPLRDDGWDWVDFAEAIEADAVLIVVPDQLGAISQSRMAWHYLRSKSTGTLAGAVIFNALQTPPPEIARSNRAALQKCGVPVWGEIAAGSLDIETQPALAKLLANG